MKSASILVIEDESVMRGFVSTALEDAGYEVHGAADGAQGLAMLDSIRCDLVITDLLMPNKEGLETCRELRAQYPDVAIIAISGAAEAATYFTILGQMGVTATMFKPFSREELLAAVRGALEDA